MLVYARTQGGVGVLGRYPVFLPVNGSDASQPPGPNDPFFGLISSLITIPQLIKLSNLTTLLFDNGFDFQLQVIAPVAKVR